MTEEVPIWFIVWKSPTYQLHRRAGQAIKVAAIAMKRSKSIVFEKGAFQVSFLSSGLLSQVHRKTTCAKNLGFQLGRPWTVRELAEKPYFPYYLPKDFSLWLESHLKQFSDISPRINNMESSFSSGEFASIPISCPLFNVALIAFPSEIGYGWSELINVSGAI